ncbi:hypothetical protein BRADI_2g40850v3 [Brachypodium distachyon]|uniref:F-box protein AT5G49610-like beta-propeller domain-containing protein n=1 Tax=Brachypodium distachyon TaxID=15368 RepID=I1HNI0_BRADI|nr:hypothetical protein BRADI_2g40850v3 [Brachypodium distachyon]
MAGKTVKKRGKTKTETKAPPSTSSPTSVLPPPPLPLEPQEAMVAAVDVDVLPRPTSPLPRRSPPRRHRLPPLAPRCRPCPPPLSSPPRLLLPPNETPPRTGLRANGTNPLRSRVRSARRRLPAPLRRLRPDISRFRLYDCHQGLLLLEPTVKVPKSILPRLLVLDPATHRRVLLPPPPRDTVPDDHRWRRSRYYVGSALLSRAHPSNLSFEAVCFAIDDGHPRAWVASVDNGECCWRALPRDKGVLVSFDPWGFERRCVHAAGKMYWHICNSGRMLQLDPSTLHFSYLLAPALLGDHFCKYRIGEMPDRRLCIATVEDQVMQLWVRGETGWGWSDNGWVLEREMNLVKVFDTVPGLPRDTVSRIKSIMLSNIDAGRTGRLFIQMCTYGHYSFDPQTRKLERLVTKSGKEYGNRILAYFLSWPPAFLAQED